jgi:hypothetical protein
MDVDQDWVAAVRATRVNDVPRTAQYSLECLLHAIGSHDPIEISNDRTAGGIDVRGLRRLRYTVPGNADQQR